MARGRPAFQMTDRRKQVLCEYAQLIADGETIRLAEIARRCGLYDYRHARRVVNDLKRIGAI